MELRYKRTCYKHIYYTKKDAREHMKVLKAHGRKIGAIYKCDECNGFHLTSMDKECSVTLTLHKRAGSVGRAK